MLQDVTIPDNEQPDILGEMLDAALATRPGPVRTSPYCEARQEAVDDLELAAEWQMASDALAHDENQALRMLARQRTDERTHTAWLESQVYARGRKLHAAYARIVSLEREIDALRAENAALREERDTLAAKLDAANAKLAALENAALVADATLGDKPRKVWTEDVKRAILTALVEAPRNLSEMRADGWMAEVPDRQFAACILEMSRTWQLMRPVPGAPEGTYELTPDGADSARAMLADADDDVTVALMDERARPPMKLTPPARKPDAAA